MKTFIATPEEFGTGQAFWKARDIIRPPRKSAPKLPPRKPLEKQVGTITPEQFGRGDAYWTGRRREGHRTTPSAVIKPMAEDIVSTLLDEAMNRRGFLGRLGGALAGMVAAPAAMAQATTAAAPAAAAATFLHPWTWAMQHVLEQCKARWIAERTTGWYNVAGWGPLETGSVTNPISAEEAEAAWKKVEPKMVRELRNADKALDAKLGLTRGPIWQAGETADEGWKRYKDSLHLKGPKIEPPKSDSPEMVERERKRLEGEQQRRQAKRERQARQPRPEQPQPQQEQPRQQAQQPARPERKAKRVWPPRQQQGREEPWTDANIMPESIAEGLAGWLLEDEEWSPNWQPDQNILAWFKRALSAFRDGQTWVVPGSGHAYLVYPSQKVLMLLAGDQHDPKHWHDKTKRAVEALGWTMNDWSWLDEPDDEPEDRGDPDQMSFAECSNPSCSRVCQKCRCRHTGLKCPECGTLSEADEVYPSGFTAKREGDEVEYRFDASTKGYRFSKFWKDEWTGKRRKADNISIRQVSSMPEAKQWLQKEMKRWADGGWEVATIQTSTMAEAITGKQNKFNPKGLRRDHRGRLLDKWGREMEVDWDEFDKRRVKTADVNEPYLKPPAQKNPLHNSTRPVAEALGGTEDGPDDNEDWHGEDWKSEEDLEREAVEQGEQTADFFREKLPPEMKGLLDKSKLSPSPEQRKKSDDFSRQCREAAAAFNKMNERLLSSLSAVAPSVQWLPEGDEEDDFPVKPVVATKVVGQVYLASGLMQGGTRDGEVIDPKAVAKLCSEYGIEVLQLVHQGQSRSTIADRMNTIGVQNDLANALSAKYRPLWKSAMHHDEAVTLSTLDDDYWLSVTFSATDSNLTAKAQWFAKLVRTLKQHFLRMNWPVGRNPVR